jgi:hypothetical protein
VETLDFFPEGFATTKKRPIEKMKRMEAVEKL